MKLRSAAGILSLLILATPLLAQSNLLVNGAFDGGLGGWGAFPDERQSTGYSPLDATGRPGSGSAEQTFLGPSRFNFSLASISQVFAVVPGGTYQFGAKIRSRALFVTANFLPPKVGIFWLRADGRTETTQSARVFASGATSGDVWISTSGTGVAPPDAAFGIIGLFNPEERNFTALFDDVFVNGPPGGCSRAPRDVAISFRGRVSGCGPLTSSCIAGEIIDFAASLPSYEVSSCDVFSWNFGDGGSSTEQRPTHVFTGAGPYQVTLRVENVFGSSQATTTFDLSPRIVATSLPGALVQGSAGGATTSYTLRNIGGSVSQLTLAQSGTFFRQEPTSFSLQPGESRSITVTGLPVPAGRFEGSATVTGAGVPLNSAVRIMLLSSPTPPAPVSAGSVQKRIDVQSSPTSTTIGGTASFANRGSIPLQGLLVSDVPWLIPQSEPVTIAGGQTAVVSFTIDRTQRTDEGQIGAATGNLSLVYLNGNAPAKTGDGSVEPQASPGTSATAVAVVHTVSVGTSPGTIPALAANEVALFIPGIAHAQGTGLFISDLTLTNLLKSGTLSNFRMYFRPAASATSTASALFNLTANQPLKFGDIAQTVFNVNAGVGTVQLRGLDVSSVSAAAAVFNTSNPGGTYGTSIPAFRSDRSVGANERLFLAGLKSDATNHTNLLLQETSGNPVSVGMTFFNEQGVDIGTRTEQLIGFGMVQIGAVAPIGAVSVALGPSADSTGRVVAYASPVDRASGDSWTVVDWARQYGYDGGSQVLIPVVAAARGANNTYFRTDAALMNTSNQQGSGTLRFYSRGGQIVDRAVNVPAGQSILYNDLVTNLFGVSGDDVGYVVFTPSSAKFALTSRTYTTVTGENATFGSGTPTLSMNGGTRLGQTIRFGGLDDASLETVQAGRAGTFRTNAGMVEISGQQVTLRLTLRYSSGGQRTATQAISSAEYTLAPRQFLQINGISSSIIGAQRSNLGDLSNMQLDIEVIGGAGAIVAYTSSVDNGTGDSQLRIE